MKLEPIDIEFSRTKKYSSRDSRDNENVIAVFSGHQHWTKQIQENGKNYYVVDSLTDNVDMLGIPDGVYLEVFLENKDVKFKVNYIKL